MWWALLLGGLFLFGFWRFAAAPELVLGVALSENDQDCYLEARMLSAAQAWVDWHNRNSGARRIRLVTERYIADPTHALGELKEQGALGVLGFSSSSAAEAAFSGAAHYQLPLISVSAGGSQLSRRKDWFFRVRPDTGEDTLGAINLMIARGLEEVVLVTFTGNPGYVVPFAGDLIRRGEPRILRTFEGFELLKASRESLLEALPRAPQGVVVVGPPIYALWMAQRARDLWPRSEIVFSPWSLVGSIPRRAEDFSWHFALLGADTFFPFLVREQHPFARYWRDHFALEVDTLVNNTWLGMSLFWEALRDCGFRGGEPLRESLSQYRRLESLGPGAIEMDQYGDAHGMYYGYRFVPGHYERIMP